VELINVRLADFSLLYQLTKDAVYPDIFKNYDRLDLATDCMKVLNEKGKVYSWPIMPNGKQFGEGDDPQADRVTFITKGADAIYCGTMRHLGTDFVACN
jgi:hypothetical protein